MANHKRPEPLLTRAHVVAAISGLGTLAVTLGVLTPALEGKVADLLVVLVNVGATLAAAVPPVVTALVARSKVTPNEDPRDENGERLKTASELEAAVTNLSAMLGRALGQAEEVLAEPEPEAAPAAA